MTTQLTVWEVDVQCLLTIKLTLLDVEVAPNLYSRVRYCIISQVWDED